MTTKIFSKLNDLIWAQTWLRRTLLFSIDLGLCAFAYVLAHLLRFEGSISEPYDQIMLNCFPALLVCRMLPFYILGFYNRHWEYASLEDLMQILKVVTAGTLLFFSYNYVFPSVPHFPKSIVIIDAFLFMIFLSGSRLGWRMWKEHLKRKDFRVNRPAIRSLILGAGDSGVAFLKNVRSQLPQFEICGFIDDDPMMKGKIIMGVPVLGTTPQLSEVAIQQEVKNVFIASHNHPATHLKMIMEVCNQNSLHCKMVSQATDLTTNQVFKSKIRNIEVTDLLGREPVTLDCNSIENLIRGQTILVTGAGGSIGSELCRQILDFKPSEMVLIDSGENYLFDLSSKLEGMKEDTKLHYQFLSITNRKKMSALFLKFKPQVVFHAAAHKHVPLMEMHPDEAIANNISGTKMVADLASEYAVKKFIQVSTDKVVRPVNVMGMSKKAAELYIRFMNSRSDTQFITVRFGNVLGSNGSVVPLFKSQIDAGGPVTVTHPDMRRFFMLIPEAAQLIIQAAAIGEGGEIFVLDMGEQVKIVELARKMISLAGYTEKEIEIKFTGIRPGEKLYEELVEDDEVSQATFHKKINILRASHDLDPAFGSRYDELCELKHVSEPDEIRKVLKDFLGSCQSSVKSHS